MLAPRHRSPFVAIAAGFVALVACIGAVAGAQTPATKTLDVGILDARILEPNPDAASWGRVTSTPAGIDCPGDCTQDFPLGTRVRLTLTRTAGYKLVEWGVSGNAQGSGCASSTVCSLTIDGDPGPALVAAGMRPEAQLFAIPEGAGTLRFSPVEAGRPQDACAIEPPLFGDLPNECSPRYRSGTRVDVTAAADPAIPDARFVRWSDYRCGKTPSCTITVRGNVYLNAIFSPVLLEVAGGTFGPVVATPPGGADGLCTFMPDAEGPCKFVYPLNTVVTLRRDPALATSSTDEWTGSCTGRGITCEVTMSENEYVRAGTERTLDTPVRTRQAFTLEYQGPAGGVIRLRTTSTIGSRKSFACRKRTCARSGFRRGDTARITVTGSGRTRFVRWADTSVRRPTRLITVGTHTRIKAIFQRR